MYQSPESSLINRRQFFSMGAGAVALMGTGQFLSSCSIGGRQNVDLSDLSLVSRKGTAFGTKVSVSIVHSDNQIADLAITEAFAELEKVEASMSLYRDSQLTRLNTAGTLASPDPHLVNVLKLADSVSRKSGGAFDVSIQPLWLARSGAMDVGPMRTLLSRVDYRNINISDDRIHFSVRGMGVTLNGIAQGHACDRVLAVFKRHGIKHALIDAGEILPEGKNKDQAWQVGIQHPRNDEAHIRVVEGDGRCLATSGDYRKPKVHIFDPRTGKVPQYHQSVTVAAPSGALADALSTALFVLPRTEGVKVMSQFDDVDVLYVTNKGRLQKTVNFPSQAV